MFKILILIGNFLIAISALAILMSIFGILDLNFFSYGLSSGIRIVGSFAIAGCLINAISYGFLDLFKKRNARRQ